MEYDKRALKILFDTYWSSKGWRSAGTVNWAPQTPPSDYSYAHDAGMMFPPSRANHDATVQRVIELRSLIDPRQVGSAFVASLSKGRPAQRSALGSYSVALNMPLHTLTTRTGWNSFSCSICGAYEPKGEQDLNVLNFERHKWGGVRHTDPYYIAFDLDRFISEPSDPPSNADKHLLSQILEVVGGIESGANRSELVRAIKPVVPGNDSQRLTLLGILGYAGVINVPSKPGFLKTYTDFVDRQPTPWHKDDWPYPLRLWRGGDGIDRDAVEFWFDSDGRF
jgi:hypothetical protein